MTSAQDGQETLTQVAGLGLDGDGGALVCDCDSSGSDECTTETMAGTKKSVAKYADEEMDSESQATAACTVHSLADELPAAFRDYLERHDIPLAVYDTPCPRYVRVTAFGEEQMASTVVDSGLAGTEGNDEKDEVRRRKVAILLGVEETMPQCVSWLPRGEWWELPSDVNLSRSDGYKSGALFGMDAASAAAVLALEAERGHNVLDLCCAPGAKLVYLAERLRGEGRLVGVDIAEHRLAACRTLCNKYQVEDIATLIAADGTNWKLRSWELLERLREAERLGHGRKGKKRRRDLVLAEERKARTSGGELLEESFVMFDRVLVDAECTHDGSVKHIEKYRSQWGGLESLDRRVPWLSPAELADLVSLQRKLLWNGWQQLRPGGVLVYSTCSLASAQNEEVVQWLLQRDAAAQLDPLPFQVGPLQSGCTHLPAAKVSALQHASGTQQEVAARFDPVTSRTSGLFLARLLKAPFTPPACEA
eukprot:TRINITY_DN59272_c0_g1_i1.p1 TRINITY_DN59272_c0_g1~~TRINITY_DN59272_c0_g1_i1.p1  ORF type:complete len:520 (-),score=74.34 TRINITY_DN59272_c0_g1_i1:676-2109(-)